MEESTGHHRCLYVHFYCQHLTGGRVRQRGERARLLLGLLLLGQVLDDLLLLGLETLLSALAGLLCLGTTSLGLISQELLASLVCLQLVNVLHKNALVLEHVTLGPQVKAVVHVPVNLLGLPVATEQTTQDPHAAHPGQLLWHTGVGCTLSLTDTHVSSLAACQRVLAAAGPGVDRNRFANDKTILHQFTDLLAGVGVSDLIGLVRVQPDLLLAAAQDAGGQPLLEPEHAAGHTHNIQSDT